MMVLSVAEDYPIPQPLTLSTWFKGLFSATILNCAAVLSVSVSQLSYASRYTSPIAAGLTAMHAAGMWFLCHRETRRDPSYASNRQRRMPTTRRANLFAILALEVLWMAVLAILVIATITGKVSTASSTVADARSWPVQRILAVVEGVFVVIQGCMTLALGVLCYHERRVALRSSSQAARSPRATRHQGRR